MTDKYRDLYHRIGKNIRDERLKRKWTQEYLANRCDKVDRSKISDIENAKEDFMFSTLLEISSALEIEIEQLVK